MSLVKWTAKTGDVRGPHYIWNYRTSYNNKVKMILMLCMKSGVESGMKVGMQIGSKVDGRVHLLHKHTLASKAMTIDSARFASLCAALVAGSGMQGL